MRIAHEPQSGKSTRRAALLSQAGTQTAGHEFHVVLKLRACWVSPLHAFHELQRNGHLLKLEFLHLPPTHTHGPLRGQWCRHWGRSITRSGRHFPLGSGESPRCQVLLLPSERSEGPGMTQACPCVLGPGTARHRGLRSCSCGFEQSTFQNPSGSLAPSAGREDGVLWLRGSSHPVPERSRFLCGRALESSRHSPSSGRFSGL